VTVRGLLLGLVFAIAALAPAAILAAPPLDPESELQQIVDDIQANHLHEALERTDRLLEDYPNFRLAHLIRGDLLTARVRPLDSLGGVQGISSATLSDLRDEALARIQAHRHRPGPNKLPRDLIGLSPQQRYAMLVDTGKSRLYVFRNDKGTPRLVADYYVSQGKGGAEKWREGDKRTPIGVYFVTSSIPASELPEFYGSGAFPISYPNEWDRRLGRDGNGIWLHGSPPDTYARPPLASDGCVVLANQDLDALSGYVEPGQTPVVIGQGIEWLPRESWKRERDAMAQRLEAWRRDWESRDTERYLAHYASDFRSDALDLPAWQSQRRRINASKHWVHVNLSDVSMFRSPGREDMVVVSFEQHYRSNDLNSDLKKRQYWVKRDGHWQIAYEGPA